MAPANGILSALPHPLLFLLLLALFPYSLTQYCSYGYTVRSDPQRSCSCVLSSQDGFTNCRTLAEILNALKEQIPSDDCLQLSVDPGTYTLTSYETTLNYSAVISAPSGNVTFTCLSNCTTGSQAVVDGSPLAFESNSVTGSRFVVMEGITFEDCWRPLQFDAINNVTISDCTFRNFNASAVDLFNCQNIDVQNSVFHNCSASVGKAQFRGNSGGLSIGYHTTTHNPTRQPLVHIQNSQFTYNKNNLPSQNSTEQINLALNDHYYFGRGGGMGIFIDEAFTNITADIEDCLFVGNYAESFGGGLYLYADGNETHHSFTVQRCNFTGNEAGPSSFGGGLQVAMLVRNFQSPPSRFDFTDCHFEDNAAAFGGGLSTVQVYSQGAGNMVTVTRSTFHRNTAFSVGSAMIFASLLFVQNRAASHQYVTQDCTFTNNSSPGGTFGLGFIHVALKGENLFVNNTGPGLRVVGSLVSVQGNLSFIGNNAERSDGGALYISEFGQLKLYSGAQVDFINNTGRIGSAIVVRVQRSSLVFSELIFNPQCFLLHRNSSLAPSEWDDVVIRFHGNSARVGPAVFISHLDLCAWFSVVREGGNDTNFIIANFNVQNFTNWPVLKYTDGSNEAFAQVNSTSQDFYFQTEATHMTSNNASSIPISTWPGQQRQLNLVGIDQLGNPTYFIIRLSDGRSDINSGAFTQAGDDLFFNSTSDADIVRFDPGLLPIEPSDTVFNISYGFPNFNTEQFHSGEVVGIVIDTPYNVRSSERFLFKLEFENCQPGFELKQRAEGDNLLVCACVDSDFYVLTCDEAENVIVLRDSLWAGSDLYPRPHLHGYQCPAPYCSCEIRDQQICETLFYQEDPGSNRQCHGTRRGSLCGECVNGSAVGVLRTNCRDCTSENYYALGFLVIADVVAVGAVLLLSVKLQRAFPHSLKGLLFYIQTVYYATEYFPASFWDIRQYMLYLSSVLGLYFPWDFCLFPGMTALVSFAPRFIPSVTATIMVTTTLLILFFCWPREMRTRKYIWHGIWSLVLLLYAPLIHMCASLLHCPYLPGAENAEETYRWFLDGGVECFGDPGHIVLGLIAITVLIPLMLLVPAMAIFTLVGRSQKVQNNSVAEKLYSALTEGYKEEVRWWGAWDLLRRVLLIILIVALPGRSISPILILLPAFALHLFIQPYQKWWQNLIEAAVLLDYILLLLLRSTQTFLDNLSSYSGTSVPAQRGSQLAATDDLTWLFFPFFYLPVIFGVCYCVGAVLYRIVRWLMSRYQRPRASTDFVVVNEEPHYSDFGSTTPVTSTELSIPAADFGSTIPVTSTEVSISEADFGSTIPVTSSEVSIPAADFGSTIPVTSTELSIPAEH